TRHRCRDPGFPARRRSPALDIQRAFEGSHRAAASDRPGTSPIESARGTAARRSCPPPRAPSPPYLLLLAVRPYQRGESSDRFLHGPLAAPPSTASQTREHHVGVPLEKSVPNGRCRAQPSSS